MNILAQGQGLIGLGLILLLAWGLSENRRARPGWRWTLGAVGVQIALALVVSMGSALLLRTAHRLNEVHPGFDARDVTIIWTLLPFARFDDTAAVASSTIVRFILCICMS